jgi:predicted ArsR family transcriptional regulator
MQNNIDKKLRTSPQAGSRRIILDILKREGAKDASELARHLEMSAMAARQHLYALAEEKLVEFEEVARPRGRPAKMWRLTPAADKFFPAGYSDLTLNLINSVRATFGEAGMEKLLATRSQEQISQYAAAMSDRRSLKGKLDRLAELRTAEGYMAAVEKDETGGLWLLENHCPICAAAEICSGLCAAELSVFQAVLGPDVRVERRDHILTGARRCAYRVTTVGNDS